jgi:hypothetical protein
MATREEIKTLKHFKWSEFKRPSMLHFPMLQWLDKVRDRAGVPFTVTSDGRDSIPPGGSPTSLHLVGRAVDIRYPKTGWEIAKITAAVYATPRPPGEGGVEYGVEPGSPGGPHLHFGLFDSSKPHDWMFAR